MPMRLLYASSCCCFFFVRIGTRICPLHIRIEYRRVCILLSWMGKSRSQNLHIKKQEINSRIAQLPHWSLKNVDGSYKAWTNIYTTKYTFNHQGNKFSWYEGASIRKPCEHSNDIISRYAVLKLVTTNLEKNIIYIKLDQENWRLCTKVQSSSKSISNFTKYDINCVASLRWLLKSLWISY
jgi:hypothetical protein